MVIYLITNKINGKQYVGQTIHSAEKRFAEHCKPSETTCRLLNRAIKKYGKEAFEFSVLEEVETLSELDAREIYWIKQMNTLTPNGYNLNGGGNGKGGVSQETREKLRESMIGKFDGEKNPFFGRHHTDETRKRMSENHWDMRGANNPNYGKTFSPETKLKLSQSKSGENHPCYGKHLSEETKQKIGAANRGKHLSAETIIKISEAKKGKTASEETKRKLSELRKGKGTGGDNPMAKRVKCVETELVFDSIKSAAESVGVWPETLGRHLKGRAKTCGGYHWEYVEKGDTE